MPQDKIASPELRRLADEGSGEPVTVLIQPSLPQRTVKFGEISRGGVRINVPVGVESTSPEDAALTEQRVAEAGAFLEDVLGTAPRWLHAARSFVATVTPEQLRTIAGSPMIEAIWPNRERRADTPPIAAAS